MNPYQVTRTLSVLVSVASICTVRVKFLSPNNVGSLNLLVFQGSKLEKEAALVSMIDNFCSQYFILELPAFKTK